jgi:lipopolysaccharide/colanic/teichoic acid biosynthesis glycosyltransferase
MRGWTARESEPPLRRAHRVGPGPERAGYELAKRILDIAGATLGLVVTLPVLLLAFIALKLETPGPGIFRQVRVGKGGKRFTLYKLRGMYVDARTLYPELYLYDLAPQEMDSWCFKPRKDPRVTRVGRVIRALAIDELPNLINVLKGDMSLVGPRPEIPELVRYYTARDLEVLRVKPGVTSPAKVCGRDRLTFRENLELERAYVRNRSLWVDLKTIFQTIVVVVMMWDVFDGVALRGSLAIGIWPRWSPARPSAARGSELVPAVHVRTSVDCSQ